MERNSGNDLGIHAVSEFGALTHHDEIWVVDGREYITECGLHKSYCEIWLVEAHDRTTAVVIADSQEAPASELPDYHRGQRHPPTPAKGSAFTPRSEYAHSEER